MRNLLCNKLHAKQVYAQLYLSESAVQQAEHTNHLPAKPCCAKSAGGLQAKNDSIAYQTGAFRQ
jgi:hypothetical protein